jgi:hypothetical protein
MKTTSIIVLGLLAVASFTGPTLSKEKNKNGYEYGNDTVEGRWQNWMRKHADKGRAQLRKNPDDKLLAEINDAFNCGENHTNICRLAALSYLPDGTPIMGVDESVYDDSRQNKLKTLNRTICDLYKEVCWNFETNQIWRIKLNPSI